LQSIVHGELNSHPRRPLTNLDAPRASLGLIDPFDAQYRTGVHIYPHASAAHEIAAARLSEQRRARALAKADDGCLPAADVRLAGQFKLVRPAVSRMDDVQRGGGGVDRARQPQIMPRAGAGERDGFLDCIGL
jgi:hypothetical protein